MLTLAIMLMVNTGCKKDEDTPAPARSTTYNLKAQDVLGFSGTVTFTETSSTSTTISIALTGPVTGNHPAQLRTMSAVETGAVLLSLNQVDATGKSSTVVTTMTYSELIAYDGHIDVLSSTATPDVIIARGDIGGNVITTTSKSYSLSAVNASGVTGTAKFEKRVNGKTLVTISLAGVVPGLYPATINLGSVETIGGGPVKATLNAIIATGTTGIGYANIRSLDDLTAITYDNWLVYDGYLNVYQNSIATANIICQGNIGSN